MYAPNLSRSGELREKDLPSSYADWTAYARFAVTFEPREKDECGELANWALARWRRTGELPHTLEQLRSCLWFEYRRSRYHGEDPDPGTMRYCAALVREMRSLL